MIKKILATTALGLALVGGVISPAHAAPAAPDKNTIEDVANQILTAYADGDLKKGMTVEKGLAAVGEISVPVGSNIDMGIVYTKDLPSVFSLCTWNANEGSKGKAVAYKSPNNSFSPMLINCNFDNLVPLTLTEKADWKVTPRPEESKLDFASISSIKGTATTPQSTTPPQASTTNEPTLSAPKEPSNIPWGWMGFITVALIILTGLGIGGNKLRINSSKKRYATRENVRRWKDNLSQHDTVKSEWASYELDPVKILELPLLSDVREKSTTDFHAALRKADNFRPKDVNSVAHSDAISSPYAIAVEALVNAFETAQIEAKRVAWNNFSKEERSRLQRAQNLLNIAMDGNASEPERQSAYKRMRAELDGLIVMPKNTQLVIEKKLNLAITDGKEVNV